MKIKTLIPVLAVSVIASGSVLTSNTALAGSPEAQEVVRIVKSNKSGTRIITRAPSTKANHVIIPRGKGLSYAQVLRKKHNEQAVLDSSS